MKKSFILMMWVMALFGCKKDKNCPAVTITAPAAEVQNLKTYIQANNITAVEDSRGFFYTVDVPGSGAKPTACSNVSVDYIGKLTDGSVFDSGNNVSFSLLNVITGWQEGVPLVGRGGSITLYLPPSLAYGAAANGSIPASSNLIFKINLKTINQ